jgi:hypothetical protein
VPEFMDMLGRSNRADRLVRIDRQTVDRRNRPDEPVELLRLYLNARISGKQLENVYRSASERLSPPKFNAPMAPPPPGRPKRTAPAC